LKVVGQFGLMLTQRPVAGQMIVPATVEVQTPQSVNNRQQIGGLATHWFVAAQRVWLELQRGVTQMPVAQL
jgi:hypothetical protein